MYVGLCTCVCLAVCLGEVRLCVCVCVGLQSVRCRSGVDGGVCRAATAALTALQYKQRAAALNKNNDARQSTGLH